MTWTVYDKTGNTARCEVKKLEYSGEWMGECFVTVSVTSPDPIDFAIGDYLEYRGERFEINYDPTVIKKARKLSYGGAFTYDSVKFNSLSDELTRCDFLDYVKSDNLIHYSSLPKFSFFAASVQDLADRIQANLDRIYTGDKKWTVTVHDEFEGNTDVNIQVDCITVWDALGLAHSRFGANFIIRGRMITIGTAGIPVGGIFKYGKGNGLTQIERTADKDQKIVTRLRAYGSTRNLPDRYYALLVNPIIEAPIQEVQYGYEDGVTLKMANIKLPFDLVFLQSGEYIPVTINGNPYQMKPSGYPGQGEVAMTSESQKEDVKEGAMVRIAEGLQTSSVPMQYKTPSGDVVPENMAVQNLMLPGFPTSTLDPYIDSNNIGELGVREGVVYFDGSDSSLPEIFPSMEGMTAEDLEAAGMAVSAIGALDEVNDAEQLTDNGAPDENGEISKSTFMVTLKDIGFDINDYLTGENAILSMKSGKCSDREFEIQECVKHGDYYRLTCSRTLDDGLRLFFPYKDYNIEAGDKFVLLNITMPDVYIKAASERLETEARKWLSNNDYVRYSYTPEVDNVYLAKEHDSSIPGMNIHDTIKEGDILLFEDNDIGIDVSITIDKLTIREGYGTVPEYDIVLRDEKDVGSLERIQNQINSIIGGQGHGYNSQQLKSLIKLTGAAIFLSKTKPDSTSYLLKLLAGAEFGDYVPGESGARIDLNGLSEMESLAVREAVRSLAFSTGVLGNGFFLGEDENGDAYLEVDKMLVRKTAEFVELVIQRLRHVGGQIVLTPAQMKCSRVEEYETFYRCYFETTDGSKTIYNEFVAGDQARCQVFNLEDEYVPAERAFSLEGGGSLLWEDGGKALAEDQRVQTGGSRYYWRLVTGTGDNYIDLSKADCDAGSDMPAAGDDIVQLGNRDDASRQCAIVLSAYGNDAPYIKMYRGINSYDMDGKEFFTVSRTLIDIIADRIRLSNGKDVGEELGKLEQANNRLEQAVDEAVKDVNEAAEEMGQLTDELDKMASDNYISPVEKTALKQQQADVRAEHDEIMADATRYGVSPSAYASAYSLADAALTKYTHASPEYIPVESDFGDIAAYYTARQTILELIATAAKQVADDAEDKARDALDSAENANEEARAAKERLEAWAADGVISPLEKQGIKDEIARIDADKDEVADGYARYELGTPTAYNSAYNAYRADLVALSADTPENIAIPSTFPAHQTSYYSQRTAALNTIAAEAKQYVDDYETEWNQKWYEIEASVDGIVNRVGSVETELDNVDESTQEALRKAEEAIEDAAAAGDEAELAKNRLEGWAADGVISPLEKQGIKDELARVDSDYDQITEGYADYSITSPALSQYTSAYANYRARLATLSADTPENIAIPSDFATRQDTYYTRRASALAAIAAAAKAYADKKVTENNATITETVKQSVIEELDESVTILVSEKMSEMEIGAMNLILNSRMDNTDGWLTQGNPSTVTWDGYECMKCTAYNDGRYTTRGKNYSEYFPYEGRITTSADVWVTKAPCTIFLGVEDVAGVSVEVETAGQWVRVSGTQVLEKGTDSDTFLVYLMESGATAYFKDVCCVKGDVAAAWSEAPDETKRLVEENKAEIEVTKQSITNLVTKDEYNEQGELITAMQSQITQTAGQVSSVVSATDELGTRMSEVEQTADGISLTVGELGADVDGLKSSNRNLLRNSGMYDTDGWIGNNSPQSAVFQGYECMKCTGYGYGRYTTDGRNIDYGDLPASGQTVTVSADVYVTAACYLYLGFEGLSPSLRVEETGKWVRVHHTQAIASYMGNFTVYLMSSGVTAYIKNVKLEAGGTATAWASTDDELLRTGVDIRRGEMVMTADNVKVQDNSGTQIALFTTVNGKPVVKAEYIDVDNLEVRHSAYIANGKTKLNSDGSGSLANGGITWDASGNAVFNEKVDINKAYVNTQTAPQIYNGMWKCPDERDSFSNVVVVNYSYSQVILPGDPTAWGSRELYIVNVGTSGVTVWNSSPTITIPANSVAHFFCYGRVSGSDEIAGWALLGISTQNVLSYKL